MHPSIREKEWQEIEDYADAVRTYFMSVLANSGIELTGAKYLLARFEEALSELWAHGRGHFHKVDEAHNEICVAANLLSSKNEDFLRIDYEPPLGATNQTIDFVAYSRHKRKLFVDVKTIAPRRFDRWGQYRELRGKLQKGTDIALSRNWLGGELWHDAFASRSRVLEYTLELEEKITALKRGSGIGQRECFILMFCDTGGHWHEDELEDFVSAYRRRKHRPDDPFADMEAHYIANKSLKLNRLISRFACMQRPQFSVRHMRLNWKVQAPTFLFC